MVLVLRHIQSVSLTNLSRKIHRNERVDRLVSFEWGTICLHVVHHDLVLLTDLGLQSDRRNEFGVR